jgi:hypothetical protein
MTSAKHLPGRNPTTYGDVNVSRTLVIVLLSSSFLLMPRPAFAYIDPGSGSMAYQVLLTALLAGLFAVRRAITWITGWFRARHPAVEISDDTDLRA